MKFYRLQFILILLGSLASWQLSATVVAVVDSWIDAHNPIFQNNLYKNRGEIENGLDDDHNGLIDDLYGWNFYNDKPSTFDYAENFIFSDNLYRFYSLRAKRAEVGISNVEAAWIKEIYADEHFKREVSIFRRYAHGTHVASIALLGSVDDRSFFPRELKILPIKLYGAYLDWNSSATSPVKPINTDEWSDQQKLAAIKKQLKKEAHEPGVRNKRAFEYLGKIATIANCSYGFSESSMRKTVIKIFKYYYKRLPTEKETRELLKFYAKQMTKEFKAAFRLAPDTLFIVSAGNKGKNNDVTYHFPSNVGGKNVLVVAATYKDQKLGNKSNYGMQTVDIAAPGIAVKGFLPNGKIIKMSGTSQAAPFIAHYAAWAVEQLEKQHRNLSPVELKSLLLKACVKKDFLQKKVRCSGLFSPDKLHQLVAK